jgi:hypothetical protein
MKAWHITQWDALYETADTRRIRNLTFYAKSNKLVGLGINRTRQAERGLELLGVWALMEALASHAPQGLRGWFIRNGKALTSQEVAYLLSIPQEPVEAAFKHFGSEEIAWLENVEFTEDARRLSGKSPEDARRLSGKSPEDARRLSGKSPDEMQNGENHQEISRTIPLRGKRDREEEIEKKRERGGHPLSDAPQVPSFEEVQTWAAGAGVDPGFAAEKLAAAIEREDFAKISVRKHWRERFLRFWREDGAAWRRKNKKNAAAPGARPDGWTEGDDPTWWTDSLAELRAGLHGAVSLSNEKMAGRLRSILKARGADGLD